MLTWVSQCLLKQRIIDGDNWTTGAISRAKLQSNHHHQQTNTQFFYRPDALPVTQPTVSMHWREKYHIPWTCLPHAHWGWPGSNCTCRLFLQSAEAPHKRLRCQYMSLETETDPQNNQLQRIPDQVLCRSLSAGWELSETTVQNLHCSRITIWTHS